jgi:L-alanine-DL-glutamate epimerase-like enolase superfamily enzyme
VSVIREVRVDVVEVPFREPIATAAGHWERRRLGLLRLGTVDGTEGLAEVATDVADGLPAGVATALTAALAELLQGVDAADDEALGPRLAAIDRWPVLGRAVRSAVETATVDGMARAAGLTAAASLAPRPRARVRLNGLVGAAHPDAAAHDAAELVAAGFGCLKVKGGGEPLATTVARVAAVRDVVGSQVDVRLDVNGAWDLAGAAEALRALAPFDLEYVEQPVPAGTDPDALAGLRWHADVPVAADEAVADFDAARRLLAAGAVDALVVKPARVGGLRQAWRIAEAAAAAGIPVVVSTVFESGLGISAALQLAAALPGEERAHGLATADLLASDLLVEHLTVAGGWMEVPVGPGIGVSLDPAAVETYRVP